MIIVSKEFLTFGGLVVTLVLGLYNLIMSQRIARRASIVGAVTAQRLKWGEEIQELIGSYCGAAHYLRFFPPAEGSDERRKRIDELGRLRHRIPLNLCQHKENRFERRIERCVRVIADMTFGRMDAPEKRFRARLNVLVRITQDLLRDNWIAITDEARLGLYVPRYGGEAQDPAAQQSGSRIRSG